MPTIDDLRFLGAPVEDPVATARYIAGLILTRRQKAALLRSYMQEKGIALDASIRAAADAYSDLL